MPSREPVLVTLTEAVMEPSGVMELAESVMSE